MKKNLTLVFWIIFSISICHGQPPGSNKRAMLDNGHNNAASGSYFWLSKLFSENNFDILDHKTSFDKKALDSTNILIIVNPLAEPRDSSIQRGNLTGESWHFADKSTLSAYTKNEVASIRTWVRKGGSLLLVLDHAPYGKTGGLLAMAFGVKTRNVYTYDSLHADPTESTPTILFTRQSGMISQHPILNGVDSIVTFTGQSFSGPPNSYTLFKLSSTAIDRVFTSFDFKIYQDSSAAGRVQGLAMNYGKGRVVVLGEASMTAGSGIERTDRGDKQLVLNIIKWLSPQSQ